MTHFELPQFTIRQLLEAGAHFGHKTMRRNPKMSKYIFTSRNDISIIDLNKTAQLLHNSLKTVKEIARNNGRILFVGTKKQAADAIADAAKRCGQYHVNTRWLGGMLTNWKTVSQSIKTLKKVEEQLADSENEIGFNKKEKLVLQRKKEKLESVLGGIKNIGGYPDLVFVIDTHKEALAIAEAKKLNIPIMSVLDTNCNPEGITFPIPANDDSVKTIKLICHLLSDAVIAGVKENMVASGIDISKLEGENFIESLDKIKGVSSEKTEKKITKDKPKEYHVQSERVKKEIVKKSDQKLEEVAEKAVHKAEANKKLAAPKKPAAKAAKKAVAKKSAPKKK